MATGYEKSSEFGTAVFTNCAIKLVVFYAMVLAGIQFGVARLRGFTFSFLHENHIEVQESHILEIFSTVQRTHVVIRSLLPPSDSIFIVVSKNEFCTFAYVRLTQGPLIHHRVCTHPNANEHDLSFATQNRRYNRTRTYVHVRTTSSAPH